MIQKNQKALNFINAITDFLISFGSYLFASWLWLDIISKDHFNIAHAKVNDSTVWIALIYSALTVLLLWLFQIYRSSRTHPVQGKRIIACNSIALLLAAALLFVFRQEDFSRGVLGLYFIISTLFLLLKRVILQFVLRKLRAKGYNQKNVIIIGDGNNAERYIQRIEERPWLGIHISEHIKPGESLLVQVDRVLHGTGIDEVILALDDSEISFMREAISACEKCGTKISLVPFYNDLISSNPTIHTIGDIKLIQLRTTPLDIPSNAVMKRLFDMIVSFISIALLSPLFLLISLLIKISSPGPVFFHQERVGLNKKKFMMYKFRSMRMNDEQNTAWSTIEDDRRTKIGAILRKTSLDELPQLFNTLKGDMSLVGPRPEIPFFVEQFRETVPLYMVKYQVRPGITGWAQVNGFRGDTSIVSRVEYDLWYIEHWSLFLDLKILFKTIFGGMVNNEKLK